MEAERELKDVLVELGEHRLAAAVRQPLMLVSSFVGAVIWTVILRLIF